MDAGLCLKLSDVSVVFLFLFFTANPTCKKKEKSYYILFSFFFFVLEGFVLLCDWWLLPLAPPPFNDLPCTSPGPDWPALYINPGSSQTPLDDCCASRMCQNYLSFSSCCGPQDKTQKWLKKTSALVQLNSEVVNVFPPLKKSSCIGLQICCIFLFFPGISTPVPVLPVWSGNPMLLPTSLYFSPTKIIFIFFFSSVILKKQRCQTWLVHFSMLAILRLSGSKVTKHYEAVKVSFSRPHKTPGRCGKS